MNDHEEGSNFVDAQLAKLLGLISAWTTRLWVANRPTAGLTNTAAELAYQKGPKVGEDAISYWETAIGHVRNRAYGVPTDEDVRVGVRNRKAYGGATTQITTAVLYELVRSEQPDQAPIRDTMTVEHVMPRKLNEVWKLHLGDEAEHIHHTYCDKLANLTLSGNTTNSIMGGASFQVKRNFYKKSSISMTRSISTISEWDEEALSNRATNLADQILHRWPWRNQDLTDNPAKQVVFKWKLGNGVWHDEFQASKLVLNVTSALLSRTALNYERLSGESATRNVHPITRFAPGRRSEGTSLTMVRIPGHDQYVINPYANDQSKSVEFCKELAERCFEELKIEYEDNEGYVTILERVEIGYRWITRATQTIGGVQHNSLEAN